MVSGAVIAALALLMSSAAWGHLSFEASLNALWILLAFAGFAHWGAACPRRRRVHAPGIISLVFALALLFPVISANDDLAQLDLINDAETSQGISANVKSEKEVARLGEPAALPAGVTVKVPVASPAFELATEFIPVAFVSVPADATGNHSPPRR